MLTSKLSSQTTDASVVSEKIHCYVGLRSPGAASPVTEQIVTYLTSAFRSLGFTLLAQSPRHLVIEATADVYELAFRTGVVRRPQGGYRFARAQTLPPPVAPYVQSMLLPLPVMKDAWPDPPNDIRIRLANNNKVRYCWGNEYAFGGRKKPVLFLSDVRRLHGADIVHEAGVRGQGVTAYIIDTGLDLSHPYIRGIGTAKATPFDVDLDVRLLSVFSADDDANPALRDLEGHGTFCAAALLAMAPKCRLRVLSWPKNFGANRVPGVKELAHSENSFDSVYLLSGLARILQLVDAQRGRSVVSLSAGLPYALDAEVQDVWSDMLLLIRELKQKGVPVFCSSGNNGTTEPPLAPQFPAMYEDVICVGGAYPKSLNDPLDPGYWYASNIAISFSASYVDPGSTELVGRNYPDVCGICGDLPHGNLVCAPVGPSLLNYADALVLGGWSSALHWPVVLYDAIYSDFDGTEWNDGWAVGTGTSFATPCVAGIGCLVLSGLPDLAAMDVEGLRSALAAGCVDVRQGVSGGGHPAAQGSDIATGSGFVSISKLFSLRGNPYSR